MPVVVIDIEIGKLIGCLKVVGGDDNGIDVVENKVNAQRDSNAGCKWGDSIFVGCTHIAGV